MEARSGTGRMGADERVRGAEKCSTLNGRKVPGVDRFIYVPFDHLK